MIGVRVPGLFRRVLFGAGLAIGLCLLSPVGALAHALVVRSDPAAGSSLTQVPAWATVTFSEVPEPSQSWIQVFNGSGAMVSRGRTQPVPGAPLELRVQLPALLNGVYTVRWKTVSADDGHSSSGSFTFGVGAGAYLSAAGPAPALVDLPTTTTPPIVAGHWIFYVGLGLLVGGAWVSLFTLQRGSRRLLLLTLAGSLTMLGGLAVYGVGQALADGIELIALPATSLGLGLLAQAVPGVAAAACVEVGLWRGATRPLPGYPRVQVRAVALGVATFLAAVTIAIHVLTTHAVASQVAWLMLAAQWAHVAGFATWIGGLAALLIAVGSRPSPARTAAVRRFSQVAVVSLVVVGLTGLLRAEDEVAAWNALLTTLFGQLVMVKIGLLAALATLGAINRLRSVPAAARTLAPLRRVGRIEVGVAAVTLVASALLTSLVPPAFVHPPPKQPPPPFVVAKADGPGLLATLRVGPGYPGTNEFTLRVRDARTGEPVPGEATLAFAMAARPDVPATILPLRRTVDGSYGGTGSNLSLIGDWQVTAILRRAPSTVSLPFRVTCRANPAQPNTMTMGRMPMVHGVRLSNGWQLQGYLNPGHPGRNTLHVILTDQRSGPADLTTIPVVTAADQGGRSRTLHVLRVTYGAASSNHFYSQETFEPGRWTFQFVATTDAGARLRATFTLDVSG